MKISEKLLPVCMLLLLLTACAGKAQETVAPTETVDGVSAASQSFDPENLDGISGASQKIDPEAQLPQEEIRSLALSYLRGFPLTKKEDGSVDQWAYREMYQIATVHGNLPGLSSVEFVIDPDTMRLYASSEKGTEKVLDIEKNPNVVLYWYHQIGEEEYIPQVNDYFNSYGVQIKGTARLMTGQEESFYRGAGLYMRTLYGPQKWDQMQEEQQHAIIDKLMGPNEWIEVIPHSYIVNTLSWGFNKEDSRRPQFYDPDSPYYGKSVRQEYFAED